MCNLGVIGSMTVLHRCRLFLGSRLFLPLHRHHRQCRKDPVAGIQFHGHSSETPSPRWARCIAPAPRSPAYRYWRRPLQGNRRLARFVLPWPHSRCWLCWPLRCRLRQRKRWSADAVAVQGVLLNPICQEELYNPGRDVSINPNEDSIRTPWSPVPDVRLGYASTGQSKIMRGGTPSEWPLVVSNGPCQSLKIKSFIFRLKNRCC